MREEVKVMADKLKKLCGKYDINTVFDDFLTLSFSALSNSVCFDQDIEDEYLRVVAKYTPKQVDVFVELFAILTLAFEKEIGDILGELFMTLGIANNFTGQFFTPFPVACLTAELTASEKDFTERQSVLDPCVGGGSMLLALCKVLLDKGINYQDKLTAVAKDIDLRCVKMTYIQLSLVGVMARVVHGDTLLNKDYASYYTPMCKIKCASSF